MEQRAAEQRAAERRAAEEQEAAQQAAAARAAEQREAEQRAAEQRAVERGIPSPELPSDVWGVDEIDGSRNGERCPQTSKSGFGVDVYIIDTGCAQDNGAMCTSDVDREENCADGHGHGSHVAGTATGDDYGVAPGATRHCLKVFDAEGGGTFAGVVMAIARAVEHHEASGNPGVINLSLAGGRVDSVNEAVNEASGGGLYMSIAAGNDEKDACDVTPASATVGDDDVYSVAAHDIDHMPSSFTNRGACVDISAPGDNIVSDGGAQSGTRYVQVLFFSALFDPLFFVLTLLLLYTFLL